MPTSADSAPLRLAFALVAGDLLPPAALPRRIRYQTYRTFVLPEIPDVVLSSFVAERRLSSQPIAALDRTAALTNVAVSRSFVPTARTADKLNK